MQENQKSPVDHAQMHHDAPAEQHTPPQTVDAYSERPMTKMPEHSSRDMDAYAMMGHGGMSADAMAYDMRNRFFVSLFFTIPIFITSHLAELFGLMIPPPFGLSIPVFGFILATPVVVYGA